MKLVSFRWQESDSYGAVLDGGVIDLGKRLGDRYPDLRSVLAADALGEAANAAEGEAADVSLDDIVFLPVIPNPGKIVCVGFNYLAHREEAGREETRHPAIFTRFPETQLGHGQPVVRPRVSDKLDYEGEVIHVVAERLVDLSPLLSTLADDATAGSAAGSAALGANRSRAGESPAPPSGKRGFHLHSRDFR